MIPKVCRYKLILVMLIIALCLLGCSVVQKSTQSTLVDPETQNQPDLAIQLAIGTLNLEGTDHAVTSEQAAELLPLWEAYQWLHRSDTTSVVELDAVAEQIQGVMTLDQVEAINKLDLGAPAVVAMMKKLGIVLEPPDYQDAGEDDKSKEELEAAKGKPDGLGDSAKGGKELYQDGKGGLQVSPEKIQAMKPIQKVGGSDSSNIAILVEALVAMLESKL